MTATRVYVQAVNLAFGDEIAAPLDSNQPTTVFPLNNLARVTSQPTDTYDSPMTDTQLPASVTANLSLLPGGDRLLPLHDAELPQKDDLCGAFWGTLALRVAGITTAPDGGVLDQDTVGALAGSVIARGSHADELPPGEPGRSDYRLEHPRVDDPKLSGTSIAGVIRAIGALSEGGLEAVPISGPFETEDLRALFAIIRAIDRPGVVVMNVGTQYLWGAAADEVQLNTYLETGD